MFFGLRSKALFLNNPFNYPKVQPMKLKTIIVEDELLGQKVLSAILNRFCSDTVEIVDITTSVEDSLNSIRQNKPHLVFLDIKLGNNDEGAFDILKNLENIDFKIVFTTSSEQPANILRALNKYSARKYLLKPLDISDVLEAVEIVKREIKNLALEDELAGIKKLLTSIGHAENQHKLHLPVKNGFQCVPHDEIIMLRSNQNSTLVFLINGDNLATSKNLKHFEEEFSGEVFIRVSKSFIININHVERYSNEDGGTIFLRGGCTAALSETYSKKFHEALQV